MTDHSELLALDSLNLAEALATIWLTGYRETTIELFDRIEQPKDVLCAGLVAALIDSKEGMDASHDFIRTVVNPMMRKYGSAEYETPSDRPKAIIDPPQSGPNPS
jgi:hypothetical protein